MFDLDFIKFQSFPALSFLKPENSENQNTQTPLRLITKKV